MCIVMSLYSIISSLIVGADFSTQWGKGDVDSCNLLEEKMPIKIVLNT